MSAIIELNDVPKVCQLCGTAIFDGKDIHNDFVDGLVGRVGWANMCLTCHRVEGNRLGTGRGQRYGYHGTFYKKVAG